MSSDINIEEVPKNIQIKGIVTKPVRGITDEGKTIYEENLQLKLLNSGKKSISYIDCTLSYSSSKGEFLGGDSDGTLDVLKPNHSCLISIPMYIPKETNKKILTITSTEVEGVFTKYGSWALIIFAILTWLITKFYE